MFSSKMSMIKKVDQHEKSFHSYQPCFIPLTSFIDHYASGDELILNRHRVKTVIWKLSGPNYFFMSQMFKPNNDCLNCLKF